MNDVKWITKNGVHIPITNKFMNSFIRNIASKDALKDRQELEKNNIEEKEKLTQKRDEILKDEDLRKSIAKCFVKPAISAINES